MAGATMCYFSRVYLVALVVFLAVFFVLHTLKKRKFCNIPPGPKPWPLIGNFGQFLVPSFVLKRCVGQKREHRKSVSASPQVFLMDLSERYGNIYSLFIGSQLIVILTGYEIVRDALSNRADVFSDRPNVPVVTIMTKRKGIVFAPYGPVWRQQRKFCHMTLRSFGLGRLSLEPRILEELAVVKNELLRMYTDGEGTAVDLAPLVSNAVSNVISSITLGQRFHHGDRQFRTLLDLMARGLELCVNSPAILINVFPLLYHLPFGAFKEIRQVEKDITVFLKEIIGQHRSSLDPDSPRDLIDMYLVETAQQQESMGSGETSFSEDYLFYIIGDLFIAGTDTTTNTVLWMLLYMTVYPDIQEKVQAEIDSVVGSDRVPSLTDKASCPFTEATIMEVQRMTTVVPLAIPHMASETTEFRGYTIPKGTVIIPNLWSVHRDPNVWENPDDFSPARFLDKNGQVLRKEYFIPFGIGRRLCMGEQLAKMELFLMFSNLMQAFTFRLPGGLPPPSMEGRFGLTLSPRPFTVHVTPRHRDLLTSVSCSTADGCSVSYSMANGYSVSYSTGGSSG